MESEFIYQKPGVIDGNAMLEQMKAERRALPENYGLIENKNTGERIETIGGDVTEMSQDDIRQLKMNELKGIMDDSKTYILENQLDYTPPSYKSSRWGSVDMEVLNEQIVKEKQNLANMTDRGDLGKYNLTDDEDAEIDQDIQDEDMEWQVFSEKYPSLKESRYPSEEDMSQMSDDEITRWFGYDD